MNGDFLILQGAVINAVAIAAGGLLGGVINSKRQALGDTLMPFFGVFVAFIGLKSSWMMQTGAQILLLFISLLMGAAIGESLHLEERIHAFLTKWQQQRNESAPSSKVLNAFVCATLLFASGPMAILGSFDQGIRNDSTLLITKAAIDGAIASGMAASLGLGIALSALPILVYEGILSLAAGGLSVYVTESMMNALTATGGFILILIGLNLARLTNFKIINFMPSLVISIIVARLQETL